MNRTYRSPRRPAMIPCCRRASRRPWASWWCRRRRGCWRCQSWLGSACFGSSSKRRSRRSWVRRGGTRTGWRSVTGTRAVRSPWVVAGSRSSRPRVRSADGEGELPLQTYAHFAERDPLEGGARTDAGWRLDSALPASAGARRPRGRGRGALDLEVGRVADVRAPDPAAVGNLMGRPLDDLRLAVLMLDGIELKGRTNVVALGITTDGRSPARGVGRLDRERDGRRRAALRSGRPRPRRDRACCSCSTAPRRSQSDPRRVRQRRARQRCLQHKERNVLDHLPERDRAAASRLAPPGGPTTPRARAAPRARRRARPRPPRRRGHAPRGARGDAYREPARDHRDAEDDARVHQPVRVDDRVRPRTTATSSTGDRRHGLRWTAAGMLEPRPDSATSRATATSRTRPRDRTRPTPPHQQTGRATTEETPPPSLPDYQTRTAVTVNFHDERGNLLGHRRGACQTESGALRGRSRVRCRMPAGHPREASNVVASARDRSV